MSICICSFDIGKRNFAFVIEECDVSSINAPVLPPKNQRYNKDGTLTPAITPIIETVCESGNILLIKNIDLTKQFPSAGKYLDPTLFIAMTDTLDEYSEYLDKCSVFVIEAQMAFGKGKTNTMALKLAQHCMSYLTIKYRDTRLIVDFPAYHKTRILGAPRKLTKYQRKKWAVEKALEILIKRKDYKSLDEFNTHKKKDDVSDCIIQLQAFKHLAYIEKVIQA